MFRAFVVEALRTLGNTGTVLEVTKRVWEAHERDLRESGDLFYTWQYDVRWAAQYLRNNGYMQAVNGNRRAPWQLTELGRTADLAELAVSRKMKKKYQHPGL